MLRSLYILLYFGLLAGIISCDLFKTRTPAEPSQDSATSEPLTEPELVLKNMEISFQEGNAFNYARSFSDASFTFEASVNARNVYGTQLTDWNKNKEQEYFNKVQINLQKNSKITLTFEQTNYGVPSDLCEVTTLYKLDVPHTLSGVAKAFRGQAQFQLVRNSKSEWSIQKWIDTDIGSAATDSTWSDLKGAFSQ